MTLNEAKSLRHDQVIYHRHLTNADGSQQRWRVNGNIKTWKRSPQRINIPLIRGLYEHCRLTEDNLHNFVLTLEDAQQ